MVKIGKSLKRKKETERNGLQEKERHGKKWKGQFEAQVVKVARARVSVKCLFPPFNTS